LMWIPPVIGFTFFLHEHAPHRALPSFPTRRSSDLVVQRIIKRSDRHVRHAHIVDALRVVPADVIGEVGDGAGPQCLVPGVARLRSEEHTSELQSQSNLVCRLLLEKKKRALRRYKK